MLWSWVDTGWKTLFRPMMYFCDTLVKQTSKMYGAVELTSSIISSQLVRSVPLLEGMIVIDGVFGALQFIKEYAIYKLSETKVNHDTSKLQFKKDIVHKSYSLYTLGTLDRYAFYLSTHLMYMMTCRLFSSNGIETTVIYIGCCFLTLPYIQNSIMRIGHINSIVTSLQTKKETFFRYSMSKILINTLTKLDERISGIKNYHIFILYHQLTTDLFLQFVKSYAFIWVLYILRGYETTYYYYKAIKLAYYYNTGYLFNVMTQEDSVYIINIIIKEKRWKDLGKVDVVHAFYSLISNKLNYNNDTTNLQINLLKFFSVWSTVCVLKLFDVNINTTVLLGYIFALWYTFDSTLDKLLKDSQRIKAALVGVIVYILILLNTNDLIISVVFFCYNLLYVGLEELYFFAKNITAVNKMIKHFEVKAKRQESTGLVVE